MKTAEIIEAWKPHLQKAQKALDGAFVHLSLSVSLFSDGSMTSGSSAYHDRDGGQAFSASPGVEEAIELLLAQATDAVGLLARANELRARAQTINSQAQELERKAAELSTPAVPAETEPKILTTAGEEKPL